MMSLRLLAWLAILVLLLYGVFLLLAYHFIPSRLTRGQAPSSEFGLVSTAPALSLPRGSRTGIK
jgi:hypothetical protein